MKQLRLATLLLAGAVGLAACSDQADSPLTPDANNPASFAKQKAGSQSGQKLVLAKTGKATAAATRVLALGGKVVRTEGEIDLVVASGLSDAAAAKLARDPAVQAVGDDPVVQWIPTPGEMAIRAADPARETDQSDAFFYQIGFQTNLTLVRADTAWLVTKQGEGERVAILDTGIDVTHQEMVGKVDVGSSGSCVASEPDIVDRGFHGTAVASVVSTNGIAMASVAPDAELVAVKVFPASGSAPFSDIICGVIFAANAKVDVINMSLGALIPDEVLTDPVIDALQRAILYADKKKALVVASSGNDGVNLDGPLAHVPSQLTRVLSVGSVTQTAGGVVRSSFSNFGLTGVDIVAPGSRILMACSSQQIVLPFSCDDASYLLASGTSFSAPHVSGAAAVVRSNIPGNEKPFQIDECLLEHAQDIGAPGFDAMFGAGLLDVLEAATECDKGNAKPPFPPGNPLNPRSGPKK